jgi:hypothetical protein
VRRREFAPRCDLASVEPGIKTPVCANFTPRHKNLFKKLPSDLHRPPEMSVEQGHPGSCIGTPFRLRHFLKEEPVDAVLGR